jgi:hypothetical protein
LARGEVERPTGFAGFLNALWTNDIVTPLSAPARALFLVIACGMAAAAVVLFVVDLLGTPSSTGGLIFVAVPVYAGIAYAVIFIVDRAVRAVRRLAAR